MRERIDWLVSRSPADGARLVAPLLSHRARQLYQRMDEYLPLFMLLVFFILAGLTLSFNENGKARVRFLLGSF